MLASEPISIIRLSTWSIGVVVDNELHAALTGVKHVLLEAGSNNCVNSLFKKCLAQLHARSACSMNSIKRAGPSRTDYRKSQANAKKFCSASFACSGEYCKEVIPVHGSIHVCCAHIHCFEL